MATEFNFNQDDDENENLQGSSQPLQSSGGSAPIAQPQQRTTPSGRPNAQQYLQANRGAGEKLAKGIQDQTQRQASEVGKGIQSSQEQLDASSQPLQQKLGEEGSQKIQTAFKDPSALLAQQDQLSEFQKLRDQGYKSDINQLGTRTQQIQQGIQTQVGKLQDTANLSGSEGGRFQLLRQAYGQPAYSRGQQKLDQLFLQAQPGANKNLNQNLQNIVQQQQQGLSGLNQAAQARLSALTNLSNQRAQDWQRLLNEGSSAELDRDVGQMGLKDIQQSSEARLAAAQAAAGNIDGLRQRLTENNLTATDLQDLGLKSGTSLYDVNLQDFLSKNEVNPTLAGAANVDEVARYRALKQLSGDTSGDLFGGETNIGGFKPFAYDATALTNALNSAKNKYEVENINQMIEQMRNAGYFAGASTGKGMRGRDDTAGIRTSLNTQLSNLQQQVANRQISPESYYDQVRQTMDNAWAPIFGQGGLFNLDPSRGGIYRQFGDYQNQLQTQRNRAINQRELPTTPETGAVDWNAISKELVDSGYTLPSAKYTAPEEIEDPFGKK